MDEKTYIDGMLTRTRLFIDEEPIQTVRNTPVAIAGMGGVGSITVDLLARWGVKKFRLLDLDKYEPTNLNRQLLATSTTLGRNKVEVAAERIKAINPHAEVEKVVIEMVNNTNARPFVDGCGIVIQTADRPSAKLLYLAARDCKIPLVNGHATVTGGRIQVFDYRKSECETALERLWQNIKLKGGKPITEMNPDEVLEYDKNFVHPTAPSLNFVTNMVGCWIVAEAIKVLTGKGKVAHYPKYLEFDTFDLSMKLRNSLSPIDPINIKRVSGLVKSKLGKG
ncbi:ThiF family adenylyltransferase [Geoalkalibacter halelectricus]|uniref:ThiF family adenylyltransferase n=1 Tax=Geoalkalibacter halelectricus TaxID=2847045 RepID=A0ABY5ZLC2_9BACT|nr:ThiF family adenylyltransferase [Geoalkalibacter halelectricus]MDO3379725.1 ThiF family adenylyltransferase [Geoalkalibacter halelectricus]UWZ79259.1 ThiF family adenylyltransferase [Geoalkalibacter halelectricus]